MKHLLKLMACVLAFAALSCQKETDSPDQTDPREIVFSAAAGAETPQTKVTYSGVLEGGYERIQWETNDQIRIHCPEAGNSVYKASYAVSGEQHTEGSRISRAWNVYATTAAKLQWSNSSTTHHFYAKYPDPTWNSTPGPYNYTDFKNQESALSSAPQDFIGYIPSSQTLVTNGTYTRTPQMKYMFMTAYAEGKMGDDVNFNFEPAVTAFEFTVSNDYLSNDFRVTQAELVSASHTLNGKFKVTITDADHLHDSPVIYGDPATAANRKISAYLNFTVPRGEDLVFTIFAVPQTLDDLTLRLVLSDNTMRTLDLKKEVLGSPEWVSFAPFKKYRINCGSVGDPWSYTVDTDKTHLDFACARGNSESQTIMVTSIKSKSGASATKANWYLEWSEDATNWYVSGLPSQVTSISPMNGQGNTSSETVTVTVSGGTRRFEETPSGGFTSFTFQDTPAGNSEDTPTDLSRWDFMNQVVSDYETANCYVIRAKGWYSFPLIYGDASLGNTTYSNQSGSGASDRYIGNYYSGTGIILKPEIEDAKSVSIVWQDCKASVISTPQLVDTNGDDIYDLVKFQVTDNITPCNILLKVCDGSGTCIWTWHLWMVPNELDLKTVLRYDSSTQSHSFRLLNVNLGAIPCTGEGSVVQRMYYDGYTFYLRFRSSLDESVMSDVITCQRPVFESGTGIKKLLNPHYQWGRKEPMLTPKWNDAKTTLVERTVDVDFIGSWSTVAGKLNQVDALRVPDKFITGNQWGSIAATSYNYIPYNTWATNANVDNSRPTTYQFFPIKSVYDPCPRGFCVPRMAEFNGTSTSTTGINEITAGGDGGWQGGWYVSTYVDNGTMFFSETGCRNASDGSLSSASTIHTDSIDMQSGGAYNNTYSYTIGYYSSAWTLLGSYGSPSGYGTYAGGASIRPAQMTWDYK